MILVISTALTLCSVAVTEAGRWPNPDKDPLVYIANPIEAEMPGHWVPVSIVKVILEKGPPVSDRSVLKLPNNAPGPGANRVNCMPFMIGFHRGCYEEDGYDRGSYWTGTFPPGFSPEYPPGYFSSTEPYYDSDADADTDGEVTPKKKVYSGVGNPKHSIGNKEPSDDGGDENDENGDNEDNVENEDTEDNENNEDSTDNENNEDSKDNEKNEDSKDNEEHENDEEYENDDGSNQDPIDGTSEHAESETPRKPKGRPRKPLDAHDNSPG